MREIRNLVASAFVCAALCAVAVAAEPSTPTSTSAVPKDQPLISEPTRSDFMKIQDGDLSLIPKRDPTTGKRLPPPPVSSSPSTEAPSAAPSPNPLLSPWAEAAPEYDFILPDQAGAGRVFGIDVSHHDPVPDWNKVAASNVSFVYVKVTQGLNYYDPKFADNWDGLNQQAAAAAADPTVKPLLRGAYHFLSAEGDAGLQAINFLRRAGIYGVRDPHADIELPPCIDLEWDVAADAKGENIDRWDDFSSDEIVERLKLFIAVVEAETGAKPIIYSNQAWWNDHMDASAATQLKGTRIWIADYGRSPEQNETPRTIPGLPNSLWQFSEKAAVVGAGIVDVNLYVGTPQQFDTDFGRGIGPNNLAVAAPSTP